MFGILHEVNGTYRVIDFDDMMEEDISKKAFNDYVKQTGAEYTDLKRYIKKRENGYSVIYIVSGYLPNFTCNYFVGVEGRGLLLKGCVPVDRIVKCVVEGDVLYIRDVNTDEEVCSQPLQGV